MRQLVCVCDGGDELLLYMFVCVTFVQCFVFLCAFFFCFGTKQNVTFQQSESQFLLLFSFLFIFFAESTTTFSTLKMCHSTTRKALSNARSLLHRCVYDGLECHSCTSSTLQIKMKLGCCARSAKWLLTA